MVPDTLHNQFETIIGHDETCTSQTCLTLQLDRAVKERDQYVKGYGELDDLLSDLAAIAARRKPGQVTHKIAEIKAFISERMEETR